MNTQKNPYIGPRTFQRDEGHLFFGREREARDLIALVASEKLVLFYAQSGAGKSSIVNTRLIPSLEKKDYEVLPVSRVSGDVPMGNEVDNIFVYNLIRGIVQHKAEAQILEKVSLAQFLSRLNMDANGYFYDESLIDETPELSQEEGTTTRRRALIIDQFEEVLTTHPEAWEKREDFFVQLAQAMQEDPFLWVVLVMREDYIAGLDPYAHLLTSGLRVRYYMQRLGREAALIAVESPVAELRSFAPGIADKLVENLASIKVKNPNGALEVQPGQYVEPVQLQVVCYSLWENLSSEGTRITENDLREVGDVDQSLERFYDGRVGTVAKDKNVDERLIREWFNNELITSGGIRNIVMQDRKNESGKLADEVIQVLQGDLVRAEMRAGQIWYELSHDRLIEPVQASNTKWFAANLKVFQQQAKLWVIQGRSDGLLLRGNELEKAEQEAKGLNLTSNEQAFLEACRVLLKREQRDRKQRQFIIAGFVASLVSLVIASWFWWQSSQNAQLANEMRLQAESLANVGLSHQLVQQSRAQQNAKYDLALLLGLEAYRTQHTPETSGNLLANLSSPNLVTYLTPHKSTVLALAINPKRNILISGSNDKTIILWDISDPKKPTQLGVPLSLTDSVETVAISPDGMTLAAGSWQEIILWDISDLHLPKQLSKLQAGDKDDSWVESLVFRNDGKLLVSGSWDNTITLWNISDLKSPTQLGYPLAVHKDHIEKIALSPDGKTLASASDDKTVILWDVSNPAFAVQKGSSLSDSPDKIICVAFSPDGKTLAAGTYKTVLLWDVSDSASPKSLPKLSSHSSWVDSIAFSSDGKKLASGGGDDAIILWDIENPKAPKKIGTPLNGHTDWISSLIFNPDDNFLISGSGDKTIRIWSTQNPKLPIQLGVPLTENKKEIRSIAFSPNGKLLASGGWDEIIRLWDITTSESPSFLGTSPFSFQGGVVSLALKKDSKLLASGGNSDDPRIILWDVSNPNLPIQIGKPLTGHTDRVSSLSISSERNILVSGSWDNTVILWDVSNPKSPTQWGDPLSFTNDINAVAISPDGMTLATGSWQEIILWDISEPRLPHKLSTLKAGNKDNSWVKSLVFRSDGKMLVSGSFDNSITLWNISDLKSPTQFGDPMFAHTSHVWSVALSPDGNTLASASSDKTIILWNVSDPSSPRELVDKPLSGHSDIVNSVAFSPNGKVLASSSDDKTIILWDVSNLNAPTQLGEPLKDHHNWVVPLIFSPDSKTLFSGGGDQAIRLWDVSKPVSAKLIGASPHGHTDAIQSIAFSPDRKILASGGDDDTVILWDISNPKLPTQIGTPLSAHTDDVNRVAFSPDGKILASSSDDKTIILWDVSNPKSPTQIGTPLSAHKDAVESIAFSPDGKTLASGSDDKTIILWDVSTPQSPKQIGVPLSAHSNVVESVAFSPDGKTLASGSWDNTVILWDVSNTQSPTQIGAPLSAHTSDVESVAFSPDGKTLASASDDDTVILWDISNPLLPLELGIPLSGHTNYVRSVAFNPDINKKILASGADDKAILIWDVDDKSWLSRTCAIVGRNLTRAEWSLYLQDKPYPSQATAACSQWPVDTGTPVASNSATAVPIVVNPPTEEVVATAIPTADSRFIFSDDFSDPNNGNWDPTPSYFANGKLYLVTEDKSYFYQRKPLIDFSQYGPDLIVGAYVKNTSNGSAGIYSRNQDNGAFYMFIIAFDSNSAQIWYYDGEKWTKLTSESVPQSEFYNLVVVCRGESLEFHVNGKNISVTDDKLAEAGQVGLYTEASVSGTAVEVDDFFVGYP